MPACISVKLEDRSAPTLEATVEADYDVVRWGAEVASGWAPTPPAQKEADTDWSGTSFRIRGQFSNSFTSFDADGTIGLDLGPFGGTEEAIKADGWRYFGRLLFMPGFAFGGGRFFIAGLLGLEGGYVSMDVKDSSGADIGLDDYGWIGVPLGFHIEGTLADAVTPYFTYAYAPTLETWGDATAGHFSTSKIALRVWPGSFLSGLGRSLWVEGGWLWTSQEGDEFSPLYDYELELSGFTLGIGMRF